MSGTLSLKIIKAYLLKNTDLIGKMDPYVIIKYENDKQFQYKTKICKDGHLNPLWNETLFVRCEIDSIITFDVMDYDFCKKDDYICQGQYTVQSTNGKNILDIHCQFKNSKVGELQIEIEFVADDQEQVDLYYNHKNKELINIQQKEIQTQKKEYDKRKSLVMQQNSKEKQLLDQQVLIQISNQNLYKQIEELKNTLNKGEENLELQSCSLKYQQDELTLKNQQLQSLKDEYEKTINNSFNGRLKIINISVSMRLDTGSLWDKMDPYVIFQVGSEVVRTKDVENAGLNAKFDEEFIIEVKDSDILVMVVYDKNVTSDDIAGQSAVSILQLLKENNKQQTYSLYLRGNKTGNVTFYYNYSQSQ